MKTLNKFAEMQQPDNFVKTIEIRTTNSINELEDGFQMYDDNCDDIYNGLSILEMEIVDKGNHENCSLGQFIQDDYGIRELTCWCLNNYNLVFDGYQRVKVSEFKKIIDNLRNCAKNRNNCKDHYILEHYGNNKEWLVQLDLDWLFNDYLKDEEYCLILMVNKEETFKANGWELSHV